ncbi:MAG: M23 family metallopeptidase [Bacteroidales bacterium]|jgi:murein DD-endopeptidase MepM/ murein hydrolase activator NlpD|nr:M23 family metallopeptidase [Bacteroidales bacterium]HPY81839.1 M23 family metallopeptidase [Bacteroidales bacterium]
MEKSKQKKRIEKLRDKYRLIIYNDESFEEVFSYKLNRLNVVFLVGLSSIILISFVYILIAHTTLKEYVIPDYPKLEERQKIIETAIRTDSLENQLRIHKQYLSVLKTILNDGDAPQYILEPNAYETDAKDITFQRSVFDSLLRLEVAEYESINLEYEQKSINKTQLSNLNFTTPISGIISEDFSIKKHHFAIDIVSTKDQVVRSVLAGTVIISTWTLETGFVIGVQHSNDFLSFYKHNSKLLKHVGEEVKTGEGIAVIGNTGEYTTGPHLHFELWHEGKPVDPKRFIVF